MIKPVSYLQTDPKWKNKDYSAKGEKTTIGASGCGPTAMSMVLATWADKNVTPATECAWSLAHGFKAPKQGTYYGYFAPAAKRYGLKAYQVNYTKIYGNPSSSYHATAKQAIDNGHLVIACMGPGLWTRSGHFVLVYDIKGNTIYINDPASTKPARTQGDYSLFKKQVKYYFIIEHPNKVNTNTNKENELDMTKKEFLDSLTNEEAYNLMIKASAYASTIQEPTWSKNEGHWQKAKDAGIIDGSAPERYLKRDEMLAIMGRKGLI